MLSLASNLQFSGEDGASLVVTAAATAPSARCVAVATGDRVVSLIELPTGVKRDKFVTRPGDKGAKTYSVVGLAYSPDSARLAVGQSDGIVFVYKLGLEWGDKKSICNKFPIDAAVSCVAWPSALPEQLVVGDASGRVRIGNTRTNRELTLYSTESYVVSLSASADGTAFVSGHADGTLFRCEFQQPADRAAREWLPVKQQRIATHGCSPQGLAWAAGAIVAAGCDGRVVFYHATRGGALAAFDSSSGSGSGGATKNGAAGGGSNGGNLPAPRRVVAKALTAVSASPSGGGQLVAVGGRDVVLLYSASSSSASAADQQQQQQQLQSPTAADSPSWTQALDATRDGLLSAVTALAWSPDGSQLFVGTSAGGAALFNVCWKRATLGSGSSVSSTGPRSECVWLSPSHAVISAAAWSQFPLTLRSGAAGEIRSVALHDGRFVSARTSSSIIVGDCQTGLCSEVDWSGNSTTATTAAATASAESLVRFIFDTDVALISADGALLVVEFGTNTPIARVRCDVRSKHTVSLRLAPRREGEQRRTGRVAFAADAHTVRVLELPSGAALASLRVVAPGGSRGCGAAAASIDWIELNDSASACLVRDTRQCLSFVRVPGAKLSSSSATTASAMSTGGDEARDGNEASGSGGRSLQQQQQQQQQRSSSSSSSTPLLPDCTFAQWVPGTEAVVAQQAGDGPVFVWYNPPDAAAAASTRSSSSAGSGGDALALADSISVLGEVTEVTIDTPAAAAAAVAAAGKQGSGSSGGPVLVVTADGGATTTLVPLDAAKLRFSSCIGAGDLTAALLHLEAQSAAAAAATSQNATVAAASAKTSTTTSSSSSLMWRRLLDSALAIDNLPVAQKCAAEAGDVARAAFLSKLLKSSEATATSRAPLFQPGGGGLARGDEKHLTWLARAQLAQLSGKLGEAEALYIAHGCPEEAVRMYQSVRRWEDALAVADSHGLPGALELRRSTRAALESGHEEARAGALAEADGELEHAVRLYLAGGAPGRAAALVLRAPPNALPVALVIATRDAVAAGGLLERAGALCERLGDASAAIAHYVSAHAFRPAVDLARRTDPGRVVSLESAWGSWLVGSGAPEEAVAHFIEAIDPGRAIDACILSGQAGRAAALLGECFPPGSDGAVPDAARPYWRRLAVAAAARGEAAAGEAERLFLVAGDGLGAIELHERAGRWEAAMRVARAVLPPAEASRRSTAQAAAAEASGDFRTAEALYIGAGDADAAIAMYGRARQWEALVRLVASARPALLGPTHIAIAEACVGAGDSSGAVRHFAAGGAWERGVALLREGGAWEEAAALARAHGGAPAAVRVVTEHALSLGMEEGGKLVAGAGLAPAAVEAAAEAGEWEWALGVAMRHAPGKAGDVHLRRAMALEDEGRFGDAEGAFLAAGKPREAIDMYLHGQDWRAALRVAETADPGAIPDVLSAQAGAAVVAGDLPRAETLFLAARKPELAIDAYLEAHLDGEALRVARTHAPAKLAALHDRLRQRAHGLLGVAASTGSSNNANSGNGSKAAGKGIVVIADDEDEEARARLGAATTSADASFESPGAPSSAAQSTAASFSAMAKAGDWDALLPAAAALNTQVLAHFFHLRLGELLLPREDTEGAGAGAAAEAKTRVSAAVSLLAKYGTAIVGGGSPPVAVASTLRLLVAALLAAPLPDRVSVATQAEARAAIYRVAAALKAEAAAGGGNAIPSSLGTASASSSTSASVAASAAAEAAHAAGTAERLLLLYHYATGAARYSDLGLPDVAAKCALAALRYLADRAGGSGYGESTASPRASNAEGEQQHPPPTLLPADAAFCEAGFAARAAGMDGLAFVLLNRYLDLSDALDEARPLSSLDNGDWEDTDVPPPAHFGPLSTHALYPASVRDAVRDWVLAASVQQQAAPTSAAAAEGDDALRQQQRLPRRPCLSCGTALYEPSLGCGACGATFPACIITGFPIPASATASCGSCGSRAHKAAWNAVVARARACPWCGTLDVKLQH